MATKRKPLSVVPSSERPVDADTPERFARLTRHLKTGTGQPLESALFKLRAEKEARGEP